MNRFYVSDRILKVGESLCIDNSQDLHHMLKVLRLSIGDEVEICNGQGKEAVGHIERIDKKQAAIHIKEIVSIRRESPVKIKLYQGLPKAQKMELILQKCTEIGVTEFCPVALERSVVKINDLSSESKKLERWRSIIDEAAKQCKRGIIPRLDRVQKLEDVLTGLEAFDCVLVPHPHQGSLPLKTVLSSGEFKRIAVFIGPEGGFTDEEIECLKKHRAQMISLGPRILRTETAGTSICSILQYVYGDLGEA